MSLPFRCWSANQIHPTRTRKMSNSTNSPAEMFSFLKEEEFVRGTTPVNILEQCLELCRSYIGGCWNNASEKDIEVTRIIGGISNQLYRVQLRNSVPKSDSVSEPTDVAIKLYQPKRLFSHHPKDDERLNDTIILTIMSQVGLGPKVYGIFNGGFIQAYVKHRKVGPELLLNPQLLRSVAFILAQVHHLQVPIRKEPYWNVKQTGDMITSAYTHLPVDKLIANLQLVTLKAHDIREEFNWLKNQVDSLDCPLVFCHNDFLGNNILLTEPDNALSLIDLEYCSYGSRGYDLAVFLAAWGLKPNDYENFDMPEDEVMLRFIRLYIEGAEAIEQGYGNKPENSVEKILYETKLMMAVMFLFLDGFFIHQRDAILDAIPFDINANYVRLVRKRATWLA